MGGVPAQPTPIYDGVWLWLSASHEKECSFRFLFSLPHTTNRTVSETQKVEAESFPVEHVLSPTAGRPDVFRFLLSLCVVPLCLHPTAKTGSPT